MNFVFVNSNDPGDGPGMARRHDLLSPATARDVGSRKGGDLYRALGRTGGMPLTALDNANGPLVDRSFGALLDSRLDDAIHRVYGPRTTR